MYATITDLLRDLFGFNFPLPIQTFGFFVAIAFVIAAFVWSLELKRKEREGWLGIITQKQFIGEAASKQELIVSALGGFFVGYKLVFAFSNYSSFAANPQHVILSWEGSIIGGLLFAFGSAYLRYREKEKEKLAEPKWVDVITHPYEHVGNFTITTAVAGLLGAKIFHNLENIDDFIADPLDAIFSFSGLTMYGGLIVAAMAMYFYSKKIKVPFVHLADTSAPPLLIGYAFGRIGCHMSGDGDWGIVNTLQKPNWLSFAPDWLWKYNYPNNVISEGVKIQGCEGNHCYMLPEAVFPTSLYEAIACIFLFIILWSVRKKIVKPGVFFFLYLLLNGIERLSIEQIRVNTKYHIFGNAITQAEIIATALILTGIAGIYIFDKKNIQMPLKTSSQ